MNHDHAHAHNYGDFDDLPFEVLLYIQADEVKNRKKQRKVETEVTTATHNRTTTTTTKLNKHKIFVKVADLRLKLATVQSKNIVLSNREIRLLRSVMIMITDEANDGHDCYDNEDDMMMAVVAVDVGVPGRFFSYWVIFLGYFLA